MASYQVEMKQSDKLGLFSDWSVIHRNVQETSVKIREFDVERDSLYRVRAEHECGLSEPSVCVTHYGRPGAACVVVDDVVDDAVVDVVVNMLLTML